MSDSQPITARPWYRLHRSTWVIGLVATALWSPVLLGGHRDVLLDACEHGWPAQFLRRIDESPTPQPLSLWSWSDHVVQFDAKALAIDGSVALAAICCIAGLSELRRRRRRVFWQFTLQELLGATLLVAGVCAWLGQLSRSTAHQAHVLGLLKKAIGLQHPHLPAVDASWEPRCAWFWETCWPTRWAEYAPADVIRLVLSKGPLGVGSSWPNQVTDAIRQLPSLRSLCILGEYPPDDLLHELGTLNQLDNLTLYYLDLSDDDLSHLATLVNLRQLDLSHNKITDNGLKHLHGLKRLEVLNISNNPITDAGVAELQRALPNLLILDD